MKISSIFENNQLIPKKYSCDAENINPPLEISDVPEGTKSLVLIMDDPDAPMGTFVHWVVFNISPETKRIEENSSPAGAFQGKNSAGAKKYAGPCPSWGTHHYYFKLYALDKNLDLDTNVVKKEVEESMRGHIVDSTELIGLYERKN